MRRILVSTAAAATVTLTVGLTAGCGALDKALDCANTAVTISETVNDLQDAVSGSSEDPAAARDALDQIEKNLNKLEKETDEGDLGASVGKLNKAVDSVHEDLDKGRNPDVGPVVDAADEITKVCKPG